MTDLYSEVSGRDGAPFLLLLNSLGATHAMWDGQLGHLNSFYRVIRCDARGHSRSPAPDGPYCFDDLVADAFGVLDRHGAATASVMGLSLGGMTALGMGLAQPARIERILCCAARADAPPPFVQSWQDRLHLLDTGGLEAVWQVTEDKWLSAESRAAHPERTEALRAGFLGTSEAGYRGCAAALLQLDYLRQLPGLLPPTLYVAGEKDAAAPAGAMQAMAAATPGARCVVIPGAAHVVNVDNPADFQHAIGGFLGLDVE
ncbi:alpha/beta fold hydrolase (plasmid) [Salipiger sp. H15]|uniref:Alpha/beta fold hydrolase n=1 Tax=Alloyangia sp. H15 TaxID=3029062 RepID=A0AAU8ARL3_9RHOB